MAATAFIHSAAAFGFFRFLTGLGVGTLLAIPATLVSEFAPKGEEEPLQCPPLFGRAPRAASRRRRWRSCRSSTSAGAACSSSARFPS